VLGLAMTGSQWLGFSLFYDPSLSDNVQRYPQSRFASVKPGEDLLGGPGSSLLTGPWCMNWGDFTLNNGRPIRPVSDRMPDPMPVLYYPARLGEVETWTNSQTGSAQYVAADNWVTMGTQPPQYGGWTDKTAYTTAFNNFIRDTRFSNTPRIPAPGKFLLIAAGLDRKFFTADDICSPDWRKK